MLQMLLVPVLLLSVVAAPSYGVSQADFEKLLAAIATVESGGDPSAVGDGGKAIGIFQIHRGYWQDAVAFDKTLGGKYEDCFNPAYARRVVTAYLRRYAPKGATLEDLARLHNGGCNIFKKRGTKAWDNTTAYWCKIRKVMP